MPPDSRSFTRMAPPPYLSIVPLAAIVVVPATAVPSTVIVTGAGTPPTTAQRDDNEYQQQTSNRFHDCLPPGSTPAPKWSAQTRSVHHPTRIVGYLIFLTVPGEVLPDFARFT